MYTLYFHPFSQHSRRVVSLLKAAGLPYKAIPVDLAAGEHRGPAYLEINPNHQVPTLVDGDVKLHESHAILRYLCSRHGLTDWYPEDTVRRAMTEQWLDWNNCRLGRFTVDFVYNTAFAGDNADAAAIARGRAGLDEALPILEAALGEAPYLTGDTPTIADLSVASGIFHLGFADAMPTSPNISAWFGRMSELKGFRESLPERRAA
jgi:glutathione S-transferase